jgi:membrane-associated protease RseP (regulator of RpoE activity)
MFSMLLGLMALASALLVTGLVLATARWRAAALLGMRGVGFFGGAIENPEAAVPWRQALVVGAGVVATYLVPALLFAAVLLVGGREVSSTVVDVLSGGAAAEAGMATGDRVLSVGGQPVATWADLTVAVHAHTGEPVEVVVQRATGEQRLTLTPRGAPGKGRIGIAPVPEHERLGLARALAEGLREPADLLARVIAGIAELAGGVEESPVSGPVAMVRSKAPPHVVANAVTLEASLFCYLWPFAVVVAVVTVPRRSPRRRRSGDTR